jgi:cullin 4
MFKDLELTKDEMDSFKEGRQHLGKPEVDLSVNVLSQAAWPTYPDVDVNVPADIETHLKAFEEHYRSKHSGRYVKWKHALAQAVVIAQFTKGKKELLLSSFQAIVLLLFNDSNDEELSYDTIKAGVGLCKLPPWTHRIS